MTTSLPTRVSRGVQSWLRRNPLDNLRDEMDQLINSLSTDFNAEQGEFRFPSMDFAETDKAYEIKMDVPGFKPDEVHVELQGHTLLVKGDHKEEKEEKNKTYHRVERRSGSIRRTIQLPDAVEAEKIAASCRDGILTVTLPKSADSQAKKIPVKA